MTDRRMDKMIIFGPEWLRNLSREGSSVSNNHQQNSGGATVPSVPTNPTPAPKYQLADYRYGREEMLALFDKHLEPPNELRDCQLLYIAKSQLPLALTNENFDEEARNNVPMGSPMAAERVGAPRGQSVDRGRGRGRLPFYTGYGPGRSQSTYHPTRGAEDANYGGESSAIPAQNRLWNPGNVSPMAPNARNGPEGSDWGGKEYNTRLFKRYPDNSNWRRQPNQNRNFGEDEGGWRAPELSRINRQSSMQNTSQDKWERDWNDRGRERPTSWNPTNRRPWTGDSQSPDDHLPEWAVDNSTDVGGTFDALGAFHGISSDDSAVPRYNTSGGDGQYGLSRSHTQGSLGNRGRNPIADDNYNNPTDDLWYTERHNLGKKVTKSTFDATEIKFRKSIVPDFDAGRQNAKVHKEQTDHHDDKNEINASSLAQHKLRENAPTDYAIPNPKEEEGYKELRKPGIVTTPKSYQHKADYKENKAKKSDTDKNYSEERHNQDEKEMVVPRDKENSNDELQRQFEGLMRNTPPDVDKQSVLITANNSLRQKHQNIVSEEISAPLSSQLVANDGATKDNMLSETDISQDSIVRNLWNTINFDHEDDLSMRNIPQIQQRQQLLGAGDGNVLPKTGPNLILGQNMMGNPDLHTIQSTQGLTNTDTRANSLHLQFMQQQQQQQQQQQTQQPYSAAMIALMQQKEMQLNFIPGYDKWYYEDPQLQTQGPFSSMEMTEWYRAGFFNGDLLVRRGHETHMRPLGIYGPIPPFMLATVPLAQLEMVSTAADQRPPQMPLGGPPPMGRAPNMVAAMSNIVDPAMKNILQFSNMGGNIPGNLAGNLTSNISANMSSNLTNNLTGNLSGNMATNLPGNSDLVGSPLMMQRMLSTPAETGAAGRMYGTPDMQQHKQNSAQGYQAEATMYRPYEQPPQMAFLHQLQQHTHLQDERMNQFQQPPPPLPSRNDMPSASLDLQSQRQEEPIKSFIRQLSSQQKQNEVESMWNMQGQYTWGPSVTTSSVSGSLPTSMWDMQPPSVIHPNALLPDIVKKDMKTEQQILEETKLAANRLALSQAQQPTMSSPFVPTDLGGLNLQTTAANIGASMQSQQINITANTTMPLGPGFNSQIETQSSVFDSGNLKNVILPPQEKTSENVEPAPTPQKQMKSPTETKQTKSNKTEIKTKQDSVATKTDGKQGKTKAKAKEEKKEELGEKKVKEEEKGKSERKTEDIAKAKKEADKSKKDQEKERKDSAEKWAKEGFIEVKGSETKSNKESKKKVEEARKLEESEKKRKEEEKRSQDELQRKQAESVKKLHEQQLLQAQQQQQQARNLANSNKRAAWASITSQLAQTTQKDKLSLAEIQRLEREKKVEQLKEQQQMVQLIAQQQQAAMQREQEMQAGLQLGWAKQKGTNKSPPTHVKSLSEIQAEEARRQQAAVVEEQAKRAAEALSAPPVQAPASMPWSNTHNGGLSTYMAGFWDTMPVASASRPAASAATRPAEKPPSPLKSPEPARPRKARLQPAPAQPNKEQSAATEFNKWCCDTLASYNANVDVPTFIGFLKDIESPYEVRDYVKCYLGESKDTSDFARQFLEKRSKLLRIAQATPVDDLCSPAPAINPGSAGNSEFQEVKVKGKKIKKNKMLKVDARILGFSVTASEDRINVGDIDTV